MAKPSRKNTPAGAEARFRALFEAVPYSVALFDAAGRILDINHRTCTLVGYARDEIIGRHFSFLVPAENLENAGERFAALRDGNTVAPHRADFLAKNGERVPCEVNVSTSEGDEPVVLAFVRDLRDEVEVEKRLHASQELFGALIESTIDLIAVKDAGGRITTVNQAFLDLTGQARDALTDLGDGSLIGEDAAAKWEAEDRAVLDDGRTIKAEARFRLAGKQATLQYTKTPIRAGNGEIVGLVTIARDITDERSVARQLVHAQKMDALGNLAAGIAHDFNNLLTSVIGNLAMSEEKIAADHAAAPYITAATRSAENASDLAQRLMRLSTNEEVELTAVNLGEVVAEAAAVLRAALDRRIRLSARVGDDLWPVFADHRRLHQVVMNLCLNARDALQKRFVRDGGEADKAGWIEISVENATLRVDRTSGEVKHIRPGDYVRITVSDNGVGMSEDTREHAFEPFFTNKPNERGAGLGLAMVYAIITNHDGWVTVESEPNLGTDFIVYLPRATQQPAAKPPTRPTGPQVAGPHTVLIIDDDASVRTVLDRVLADRGFRVLVAASGARGWELLSSHRDEISLIVLDLLMPEMSGKHFIELMLQHGCQSPVLVCSGVPPELAREEMGSWRIDGFLAKPFTPPQFLEKVNEIILRRAAKTQAAAPAETEKP